MYTLTKPNLWFRQSSIHVWYSLPNLNCFIRAMRVSVVTKWCTLFNVTILALDYVDKMCSIAMLVSCSSMPFTLCCLVTPHGVIGIGRYWFRLRPLVWQHQIILPPLQRIIQVSRRPYVRPSVCPSGCGQHRVRSVTFTTLAGSISYLHILLSNSRECLTCIVFCKISTIDFFENFQICNFDSVLFWLGIWEELIVWVITGLSGYSHNVGVQIVLVSSTSVDWSSEISFGIYLREISNALGMYPCYGFVREDF